MKSYKGYSRFILWEGRSLLTGQMIRASLKLSGNSKTGDLPEIWVTPILSEQQLDGDVWESIKSVQESVCGLCPYAKGNGCYVDPRGIVAHVKALHGVSPNGKPAKFTPKLTHDEKVAIGERLGPVRFGAWGDVAAVPYHQLEMFEVGTGYTHQWKSEYSPDGLVADRKWKSKLMASSGGKAEADEARKMGWRTFSIQHEADRKDGFILCPASDEAGKRTNCDTCLLCNGTDGKSKLSIYIPPHGKDAAKMEV